MSKAPAFQLYAADFYTDTVSWTATQVGAYFRLLMHEWINGPLPKSMAQLGRIAGVDSRNMTKMWSAELAKKFITDGAGMYINIRLENSRNDHLSYIESQRKRAEKRWNKDDAAALPAHMPEPCSSSSPLKNKILCAYTEDFEAFWKAYPKRSGSKKAAFDQWKKLNGGRPPIETILKSIQDQADWRKNANGEFRPEWKDPERWIKNRMWEAETVTGMRGQRPRPTRLPTEQEELEELNRTWERV